MTDAERESMRESMRRGVRQALQVYLVDEDIPFHDEWVDDDGDWHGPEVEEDCASLYEHLLRAVREWRP